MLRDRSYKAGIAMPCLTTLAPETAGCFDEMVNIFVAKQRKPITVEEARKQVANPLQFSA